MATKAAEFTELEAREYAEDIIYDMVADITRDDVKRRLLTYGCNSPSGSNVGDVYTYVITACLSVAFRGDDDAEDY